MVDDPLVNHPFLQRLGQVMGAVIEETTEQRGPERVQTRGYYPHEEYGRAVLIAAGEVQTTLTQLSQTSVFLSSFRSTPKLKAYQISRYDHIVYHMESFLIRVTGCFDRCLVLVNAALDLGNGPEDCRYPLLRKNRHVKDSDVLGPLGEVNGVVKPYREQRHIVAHRKRFYEPNLFFLEAFYLAQRIQADAERRDLHLAKLEADRVVAEKTEEMRITIGRLEMAVSRLFNSLSREFEKRYERLRSAR